MNFSNFKAEEIDNQVLVKGGDGDLLGIDDESGDDATTKSTAVGSKGGFAVGGFSTG